MKWQKHGAVFLPSGEQPWARTHATCPTPVWMRDGSLRVYLQGRDAQNVGRVYYVELDPRDPRRVLRVSPRPVLDVGVPGAFDDNGVLQTSIVTLVDGRMLMYYVGFELCHHIRYRLLTGLAISEDGGETFVRRQATPILERSPGELYFRGGPWVLADEDGFAMWYVAGSSWEVLEGKSMPCYDLRYVRSADGVRWPNEGRVVLGVDPHEEHGFGRPVVFRGPKGYRMYYSVRRRQPLRYEFGYAESADGLNWERLDHTLGLGVSDHGWDSQAVSYAMELETGGRTWLLYNGNDFGGTGFGVAERVG